MEYGTYMTIKQIAETFSVPQSEVMHVLSDMHYTYLKMHGRMRIRLTTTDLSMLDLYFFCMKQSDN